MIHRGKVIEQRYVMVSVAPETHDDAFRQRATLDEVTSELAVWGRAPIDLERVREMLLDLRDLLAPQQARVGLCQSCGYDQRHSPACDAAKAQGLEVREVTR